MRIDLKKDALRVDKYLKKRAKEYLVYVNEGPGKDDDEIRLITLGFGFDQSGWVALVFDSRPDAEFDGEWQTYIEQNQTAFNGWFKAFDDMLENGSTLSVTQQDGKKQSFTSDSEFELVAGCFGNMCRNALEQARAKGHFKKLPLAKDCRLAVEEHEGNYGWIEGEEEKGEENKDDLKASLRRSAKILSKSKKVEFWINQLEQLAAGKPCEASKLIDGCEFVLSELHQLGAHVIVPLLMWANTWSGKPEWVRGRDGKGVEEHPMQNVLFYLFQMLKESGTSLAPAEPLIQQYIRNATKVKPILRIPKFGRKKAVEHYGIIPTHAARLLSHNYAGYPWPDTCPSSNQLRNADRFIRNPMKAK